MNGAGRFEWLKSVWTVLAAMALGITIGIVRPQWGAPMARLGGLYVTFLIMCVAPIILAALSTSLARFLLAKSGEVQLRRMVAVFALSMVMTSLLVVVIMVVGQPGSSLAGEAQMVLGRVLAEAEPGPGAAAGGGWADVLLTIIPVSIVAAIAENNFPQLFFVSVLIGLLMGTVRVPATERLLELLDLVSQLFNQAIQWSTYVLPIAVMGILAGEVAVLGTELLLALGRLVILVAIASLLLMGISTWVISSVLRISPAEQFRKLRRVLVFAFGTSNSVASMPLIMEDLHHGFGLPWPVVNIVVPLGVLVARYGSIMLGAVALPFAAQLYQIPLNIGQLGLLVLVLAVWAGIMAGVPAAPLLMTTILIGAPFGIPMQAIIPIMLALIPILDPMWTVATVHLISAATVLIVGGGDEDRSAADGMTGESLPLTTG